MLELLMFIFIFISLNSTARAVWFSKSSLFDLNMVELFTHKIVAKGWPFSYING